MTRKNKNITVDVSKLDDSWPPMKKAITAIAAKTLDASGYSKKHKSRALEVSIALADDEFVRSLNLRFRGKDKATNVLSFPNSGKTPERTRPLGDVILAYETVKREARAQKKPFRHHALHLVAHGILHLIGYDHETPRQAKTMETLETRILRSFGVKNPYA